MINGVCKCHTRMELVGVKYKKKETNNKCIGGQKLFGICKCPKGTKLQGNECKPEHQKKCPKGTKLEGDICKPVNSKICDPGKKLVGNMYIKVNEKKCGKGKR